MSTPDDIQEQVDYLVNWYKNLSEETKNFWTFRWTRVEDPAYKDLYDIMKAAEKLHRSVKSAQKKAAKAENHRKRDQNEQQTT